ncbi:MAG TPA: malto-oligosyltrehalose synthase, partial [Polyangia bacterium]|nr:malto-oligosyltrehalose synthase [Polyangia bacterium]
RLAELCTARPTVAEAVSAAVKTINGVKGQPASFDALERLMNEQVYRLADWRVAAHEINYRRFFEINDLAAVRVETPEVFEAVHALPLSLSTHEAFGGFRIDHLDGLADPKQYLDDLGAAWRRQRGAEEPAARPYVVVEKILGTGENLPPTFLADGTTGYDFIAFVGGLLTRAEGAPLLRAAAQASAGTPASFEELATESKRLVLQTGLAAELTVLARRLDRISEQHRYTRDFTLNHLHAALAEVIVYLSVYRTYVREDDGEVAASDVKVIERAVASARRKNPLINASLFDFIESVLLHRDPPGLDERSLAARRAFGTHFQQLTGPVFAKGVEDTAFYRYLPLLAANEVGCDPTRLGISDDVAHATLAARAAQTPHTLSATATHDTKRGEDARARLYVLSEIADRWAATADLWWRMNAPLKQTIDGVAVPSNAEEYLLYQTLVGVWPLPGQPKDPDLVKRVGEYMMKARREAKVHTSYVNPDPRYEEAAAAFVEAVLDPERNKTFPAEVGAFVASIARAGVYNSLAQLTLKLGAPGVPDFFQGREGWDFSLVDPDNRRPVDFAAHTVALNEIVSEFEKRGAPAVEAWLREPADGRIKLWLAAAGLRLRQAHRTLLQRGRYEPVSCQGPAARYVFAFARREKSQAVITVVGRHLTTFGAQPPVGDAWTGTSLVLPSDELANCTVRDAFTGRVVRAEKGRLPLEAIFASLPVALLGTSS